MVRSRGFLFDPSPIDLPLPVGPVQPLSIPHISNRLIGNGGQKPIQDHGLAAHPLDAATPSAASARPPNRRPRAPTTDTPPASPPLQATGMLTPGCAPSRSAMPTNRQFGRASPGSPCPIPPPPNSPPLSPSSRPPYQDFPRETPAFTLGRGGIADGAAVPLAGTGEAPHFWVASPVSPIQDLPPGWRDVKSMERR